MPTREDSYERNKAVYFAMGAIKSICENTYSYKTPEEKIAEILQWVENPEEMMHKLNEKISSP